MTFSQTPWLSMLMLSFLVAINAVANGANLAVAHLDAERLRAEVAPTLAPVVAPILNAVVPVTVVPVVSPVAILPEVTAPDVASAAGAVTAKPARKRSAKVKVVSKKARTAVRATAGELN